MAATSISAPSAVPYRGILTACAMAATLMQTLDTTITNVALPYMQGSLSATSDQITWVLTSYIAAAAIMTRADRMAVLPLRPQGGVHHQPGRLHRHLDALRARGDR